MRRLLLGLVALAVLGAAGAAIAGAWAWRWYHAPIAALAAPESGEVVEIAPGESLASVATRLEARGWIEHPQLWRLFARREGSAGRIRAGEYAVAAGTSPAGLLAQFVEGRVLLHPVTLVEGWTYAMARAALQAHPMLRATLRETSDAELMERLGSAGVHPEGQFFPDTYLVARNTSDAEVLRLAHERLRRELAAAWEARRADLPLREPYEALILASIVEKETGAPEERALIGGVFVNRLRLGMKLQTDPTVIYGIGPDFDGNIRRRDLVTDTPYNTYTRHGLPPTPIALVGREALLAAVQPEDTEYVYFVATGLGDGRHVFSRTYAEHNAAVQRYLERLRATRAAGGAPGAAR